MTRQDLHSLQIAYSSVDKRDLSVAQVVSALGCSARANSLDSVAYEDERQMAMR